MESRECGWAPLDSVCALRLQGYPVKGAKEKSVSTREGLTAALRLILKERTTKGTGQNNAGSSRTFLIINVSVSGTAEEGGGGKVRDKSSVASLAIVFLFVNVVNTCGANLAPLPILLYIRGVRMECQSRGGACMCHMCFLSDGRLLAHS